jgi:hypothetical protein
MVLASSDIFVMLKFVLEILAGHGKRVDVRRRDEVVLVMFADIGARTVVVQIVPVRHVERRLSHELCHG